eukprot:gnl/MRDRNA2_/MRDRNA2_83515_c0_seq1.p1 gnl/MRDRNA2_/MRDRNA2_83515_c0~~gnl/MRDRNA2_/MRDRNA2_83515_c0_seq1.p1  ORF type:complete len:258 (+),score=-0.13 gnl/MRDRNA2_/MRDRNA2_83515_c0_seq1:111-884(+)
MHVLSQKICDFGVHPSEIESRLTNIFAFAIIDKNSSLVQADLGHRRKVSPFFFSRCTACSYLEILQNLNSDYKLYITKIGLNHYVTYVNSEVARSKKLTNIAYRLVPDFAEIINSVQNCELTLVKKLAFIGVPLFQSNVVRIKTSCAKEGALFKSKSIPLFFKKDDADSATLQTYSLREKQRTAINKSTNMTTLCNDKGFSYIKDFNKVLSKPKNQISTFECALENFGCDKDGALTKLSFMPPGVMKSMQLHEIKFH